MLKTELGRLRKANRRLCKSINIGIHDHELMKQMFSYLSHKRLNPYDMETVRADILGMALEAKKRQEPLSELIGEDHAFCDGLLANCNKSRWSVSLCGSLAALFMMLFFAYLTPFCLNGGFRIFLGQTYTQTMPVYQLFIYISFYFLYVMLWSQIIPLPYAFYKNNGLMSFLIVVSWIALFIAFMRIMPSYNVLFSVSGFTNLAVLSILGLGWWGLRYAADTLAYKQSSFGQKNGSGL